jgi:hypothetical protein
MNITHFEDDEKVKTCCCKTVISKYMSSCVGGENKSSIIDSNETSVPFLD